MASSAAKVTDLDAARRKREVGKIRQSIMPHRLPGSDDMEPLPERFFVKMLREVKTVVVTTIIIILRLLSCILIIPGTLIETAADWLRDRNT